MEVEMEELVEIDEMGNIVKRKEHYDMHWLHNKITETIALSVYNAHVKRDFMTASELMRIQEDMINEYHSNPKFAAFVKMQVARILQYIDQHKHYEKEA